MSDRWAIYIDIEGFGNLYHRENTVLVSLGDLMEGIYSVGTKCYPESPHRLFAHQTGDGFVVVGEFGETSLEVPVAITIALLRHVAARGRFAKASIGEGRFADIWSCYPKRIQEARSSGDTVPLGDGLMTIFPVMGTALINAVAVQKSSPSGSVLTVESNKRSRLPLGCSIKKTNDPGILSIDWIHSKLSLLDDIQEQAELHCPSPRQIEAEFYRYCIELQPPKSWVDSTVAMLGLNAKF